VLDLGALEGAVPYSDMFDPRFGERLREQNALLGLEEEISRPVQPYEQDGSYLATQYVCEHLQHVLGLEGLAYRSAQIGTAGFGMFPSDRSDLSARNVVLWGDAAIVEGDPECEGPAGLRYVAGSAEMLNVTRISIEFENDMWAHYVDPPLEEG
jgi:hypothetical protein